MFFRNVFGIGGNDFSPYFSTFKKYIKILIGILVRCCYCHDCPGPNEILLV